jgi:hypothetical protein
MVKCLTKEDCPKTPEDVEYMKDKLYLHVSYWEAHLLGSRELSDHSVVVRSGISLGEFVSDIMGN